MAQVGRGAQGGERLRSQWPGFHDVNYGIDWPSSQIHHMNGPQGRPGPALEVIRKYLLT